MCHCSRRYVRDQFAEAVDCLSEIFLEVGLLRENHPDRKQRQSMDDGAPPDVVGFRRKPPRSMRTGAGVARGENYLCPQGTRARAATSLETTKRGRLPAPQLERYTGESRWTTFTL